MTDRKFTLVTGLLILAVGAAYVATIRPGHDWGGDFAMYIQHAQNIAEGQPYARSGYVYNSAIPHIGPRAYPPVFPFLLAPVTRIFGFDLTAMKIEIIAFFAAALFVIFIYLRRRLGPGRAMAVVGLIGFSPYFWSFKDDVMSDIPFLLFSFLALFLISRGSPGEPDKVGPPGWPVLCGFLVYLAFGTRAIGLALVPAIFVSDLITFRRIRKFTWAAAAAALLFALPQLLLIREGGDYLDQIFLRPLSVAKNLWVYAESMVALWDNGHSRVLQWAFFILTVYLAAAGWRARKKEKPAIYEVFLLIYLSVVLLWPFRQSRWLIPAIPLYLALVLEGIRAVSPSPKAGRLALAIFLAGAGLVYAGAYLQKDLGPLPEGPHKKDSAELFDYIKSESGGADIFIFRKPRVLALYTGRRAAAYPEGTDESLWRYFEDIRARFIIVGRVFPSDRVRLRPFIERNSGRLVKTFANRDFAVYKIIPQASGHSARPTG